MNVFYVRSRNIPSYKRKLRGVLDISLFHDHGVFFYSKRFNYDVPRMFNRLPKQLNLCWNRLILIKKFRGCVQEIPNIKFFKIQDGLLGLEFSLAASKNYLIQFLCIFIFIFH